MLNVLPFQYWTVSDKINQGNNKSEELIKCTMTMHQWLLLRIKLRRNPMHSGATAPSLSFKANVGSMRLQIFSALLVFFFSNSSLCNGMVCWKNLYGFNSIRQICGHDLTQSQTPSNPLDQPTRWTVQSMN
jgi:hypothetical protein